MPSIVGGVAQLGERRVRNAKVGSSILLLSTTMPGNMMQVKKDLCLWLYIDRLLIP